MDLRQRPAARRSFSAAALTGLFLALFALPVPCLAGVERVEIASREPLAGGMPFGLAGPYEKVTGRIELSLDPAAPANARVVDLDLAPRGPDGRVHYAVDFYLLRPAVAERGNGTLFVEVPNRGGKAMVRYFNRGAGRTRDPSTAEDVGDGFLMRRGFTLLWVGWQYDVPDNPELLRLHPAWAETDPPIEGLVRADHVFSADSRVLPLAHRNHQAYPVAKPRDRRNVLTVRDGRLAERRVIPRRKWRFARFEEGQEDGKPVADPRFIYYSQGFEKGKIYEAVYVARKPAVVGLGMTAIRDVVSHFKNDPESPAPVERAIALGISQTGRFLRTFLYQGFNAAPAGGLALDGVMAHTAGAGRGSFNHRFGQPSRDAHPFSAFVYPTDLFPFTDESQTDPETGRRGGLLTTLRQAGVVPKVFYTNSSYEYWGRAAGLIHTSVDGERDVSPPPEVRIYNFSGSQHFVGRFPPRPSATRYPANPVNFFFSLRALLVAMESWVADGVEPPASRYPRIAEATLTTPAALAFPQLPGVEAPRKAHQAYRADYGERFWSQGIVDRQPPRLGTAFPVPVPQVDDDGNETGGLRLPQIAVPLATYAPWNWRDEAIGAPGELADFRGSFFPFPPSRAERQATGDPRLSIDERYASRDEYLGRYAQAAVTLVRERYLLTEDLPELMELADELWDLTTGDPEN